MKRFLIACLAVFMAVGFSGAALAAPSIFFDFDSDELADASVFVPSVGDIFYADLYIGDVDDEHGGIMSMGFEGTFDNTQVNVLSLTVNAANWYIADNFNTWHDNGAGRLSMAGGRLAGLTGTLLLGSLEFECMGEGNSVLQTLEMWPAMDYNAVIALDEYVYDKDITYGGADVTQVVPIPGAVWLLGSGLLSLVGLRRKIRS